MDDIQLGRGGEGELAAATRLTGVTRHPSLKDVAASAGVSFQTASKVLNGKGGFAQATRRRVFRAAEALDYVPNALARGLLNQATKTVGVISTDFSDTTLAQLVVGVEREARRQAYTAIVGSLDESGSDWEHYLRILVEHRVDGIIIIAPVIEHESRVAGVLPRGLPVVSLNQIPGAPQVSHVFADELGAGMMAVRHLTSLGHRRIAMVTGAPSRLVTEVRAEAYRRALVEAGIEVDDTLIEEGDWEVDGGYQATHRLLDRRPDLTGLYVQNDTMAVGALAALHEQRLRVPSDCSVVGCDNLPIASRTVPPLTTVRMPFHERGAMAMRLLAERLRDPTVEPRDVVLPVEIVDRSSSGLPPGHSELDLVIASQGQPTNG